MDVIYLLRLTQMYCIYLIELLRVSVRHHICLTLMLVVVTAYDYSGVSRPHAGASMFRDMAKTKRAKTNPVPEDAFLKQWYRKKPAALNKATKFLLHHIHPNTQST